MSDTPKFAVVGELSKRSLPVFKDQRGALGVADLPSLIDFPVKRLFWIFGVPKGGRRGEHAHKRCNQFMFCLSGAISVSIFDGHAERSIALGPSEGIHIPPMIYAAEWFNEIGSILAVLCDLPYDESDYIFDRELFSKLRQVDNDHN